MNMLQSCVNCGKSTTIMTILMLMGVEAATAFGVTEDTEGERGKILSTKEPLCMMFTHTCSVKFSVPKRFELNGN